MGVNPSILDIVNASSIEVSPVTSTLKSSAEVDFKAITCAAVPLTTLLLPETLTLPAVFSSKAANFIPLAAPRSNCCPLGTCATISIKSFVPQYQGHWMQMYHLQNTPD